VSGVRGRELQIFDRQLQVFSENNNCLKFQYS